MAAPTVPPRGTPSRAPDGSDVSLSVLPQGQGRRSAGPEAGGRTERPADPAGGGSVGGLVPSAITGHGTPDSSAGTSAELDVQGLIDSLYRPQFPSTELVSTAASLFQTIDRCDVGRDSEIHEGPTWRITISPGTVQVGTLDYARAERAHERHVDDARNTIDMQVAASALADDEDETPAPARRGRVTAWTNKSRARMIKTLSDLDWAPLLEQGGIPAMITLTLPGDWLSIFPSSDVAVEAVKTFRKRWQRSWGQPLVGPWKREFQRRGAWHLHLLTVPPRGISATRYAHGGLPFRQWLSRTWTDVLQIADLVEREKSLAAGTGIDYADGLRSTDPRRIAVYFTGHGLEKAKEYQNVPPAEWVAAGSVGRWWGVWGLKPHRVVVEVAPQDAVQAARLMRRWSRARRFYRPVKRDRVELATGRVRKRSTMVRTYQVRKGRGWVSLNDAPAFAADVARWLDTLRA